MALSNQFKELADGKVDIIDDEFVRNLADRMMSSSSHESMSEKLFALLVAVARTYVTELDCDRIREMAQKCDLEWNEARVREHYSVSRDLMGTMSLDTAMLGLRECLEVPAE